MFIGRIGMLNLMVGLLRRLNHQFYEYPKENILFEDGINIFIFENNTLLCPKGENINGFYDINKKSILIIKFKDYYEPIYHLEGNGKTLIKKCIFNNENEEIHKLFEIYESKNNISQKIKLA